MGAGRVFTLFCQTIDIHKRHAESSLGIGRSDDRVIGGGMNHSCQFSIYLSDHLISRSTDLPILLRSQRLNSLHRTDDVHHSQRVTSVHYYHFTAGDDLFPTSNSTGS
jgi:hypothetical protein